jgi:hypothetical protein
MHNSNEVKEVLSGVLSLSNFQSTGVAKILVSTDEVLCRSSNYHSAKIRSGNYEDSYKTFLGKIFNLQVNSCQTHTILKNQGKHLA